MESAYDLTSSQMREAIQTILDECFRVHKAEGSRREHFAYKQAYKEVYEIIKNAKEGVSLAGTEQKAHVDERSTDVADSW